MLSYPDANPYPLALMVHCCDVHVDCRAAPPDAVHRFMDPAKRRINRDTALSFLRVWYGRDE